MNNAGVANGADKTFTTAALVDSDGDRMPDDYERDHGFDPNNASDAALDSDGDGMTNLQEYLAGTDPRSAGSVLRITSIQKSAGDIVISFPSVFGKAYRVEQKTISLPDGRRCAITFRAQAARSALSIPKRRTASRRDFTASS